MVAESGTHQELLELRGRYYNMWRKQIRAERALEQASQAVAKAKALTKAAMDRPGSSGNSPSEDVSENEGDNRSSTTSVIPSLAPNALAEPDRDTASDMSGSSFGDDKPEDGNPAYPASGEPNTTDEGQTLHSSPEDGKSDTANQAGQSKHT
jgi:hypothetical protein